jgi:hypothetical protein
MVVVFVLNTHLQNFGENQRNLMNWFGDSLATRTIVEDSYCISKQTFFEKKLRKNYWLTWH